MEIDRIEFTCSSPSLASCPEAGMPEFAFIGRSNVGKSSLINMLAGSRGLAKVSGTPGKTRLLNFFRVQSAPFQPWFLVDLPGYGYAKTSQVMRRDFEKLIRGYLSKRDSLAMTFVLIDSRLEPQAIDLEFMNWMGDQGAGFVILFTKTDKMSNTRLATNIESYRNVLKKEWSELPAIIPVSSHTRTGRQELLDTIGKALEEIGHRA
ncbi:MAG TPA: ribosome biogenesis GTP-binding protein YihA/YsxC [Bacteroidales bacterium]|nr:ribosome biogenesis GTP-binding protein YihA/YsxC [Bacteroidales bacterium]